MSINPEVAVFPNNVVSLVATHLQPIDDQLVILRRPLRRTDPVQCVGIAANTWQPDDNSYEMRGGAPTRHEPTLASYTISIECFIKDMDEERGLKAHSVLSTLVRNQLHRDDAFLVALRALTVTLAGITERVQRYGVRTQRYSANEIEGAFFYLSVLELWVETEST